MQYTQLPLNGSPRTASPSNEPAPSLASAFVRALCLVTTLAAIGTPARAQQPLTAPFTQVGGGVFDAEAAYSVVGAWGDYDNDGWLDLFVGNQRGARSWLFRNNRDGTFVKEEVEPITTDVFGETWGAAWADYDNDGWLDLVVSNHDRKSPPRLYRNHGGGSFSLLTAEEAGPLAGDISRTQGLAWADYDNDGRLDLFLANGDLGLNYPDVLYHNEGGGRFSPVTNIITTAMLSSSMGTWSDYDNDGDMDLFVTHTGGSLNTLFRNDPQGFTKLPSAVGLDSVGESLGSAWGDYDNDGDLDLFIANVQLNGPVTQNFFYHNRGGETFERIVTGAIATDREHFVSCAWVDYDNDGWLDLFLTVLNGTNRLYRNRGDGTFARVALGNLVTDVAAYGSSSWGDYDNDGFPDLFITRGTIFAQSSSALFHNDGNSNSWVKVRCVGTDSNRSAIGAKVRAKARISGRDQWQMRQIAGSEGWVTFNSLDVLIGLGDATVIDTLRVEWPSGAVQEFHDLAVKQTLTIVERTSLSIARGAAGDLELKIRGPRQQQYRIEKSVDLANWSSVASLTITGEDGTGTLRHAPAVPEPELFFRAVPE